MERKRIEIEAKFSLTNKEDTLVKSKKEVKKLKKITIKKIYIIHQHMKISLKKDLFQNGLDFKQIIVAEKTRNSFEYNNIIISIDSIENLGEFIELEFKTNLYDNEDDSMKYIMDTIEELGINVGKQIFARYPQLVMEKNHCI